MKKPRTPPRPLSTPSRIAKIDGSSSRTTTTDLANPTIPSSHPGFIKLSHRLSQLSLNIGMESKGLKTEIDDLRSQLAHSQLLCDDLKVSNERLSSRLDESEKHLTQFRNLCAELQTSNHSFRTNLEESQNRLKSRDEESNGIKKELARTHRIREDLRASNNNIYNRLREREESLRKNQNEFQVERGQMDEIKLVLASWGTILDARLRFVAGDAMNARLQLDSLKRWDLLLDAGRGFSCSRNLSLSCYILSGVAIPPPESRREIERMVEATLAEIALAEKNS